MKYILALLLFLYSTYIAANEDNEVNVIELHASKTLDQLVLENDLDTEEETLNLEEVVNDSDLSEKTSNTDVNSNLTTENIEVDEYSLFKNVDFENLELYFNNINNINSVPLYNEYIKILTENNFYEVNTKKDNLIYLFAKKLVDLGEIQKAYNFIKSAQLVEDKNNIFYKTIELNYLFSTYQLKDACELKNEYNIQKINLKDFYIEKADIFCLIMEEKIDEANLLNSILIETEINNDKYFQKLLNILLNPSNDKIKEVQNLPIEFSENLIFLYSAMLRIAELPLNEKFLDIDPNNLAIPIILSNDSEIKLRLKAANKAFLNNLINIESLAALYQSVDFNSVELNDPIKTIENLSGNGELTMAFYFQLANVQIFPSSRLKVIFDYWKFAESIGLEKIAYNLTYNIISALEPSSENAVFGYKIAKSLMYNDDYTKASKWLLFAETANIEDQEIEKVKLLYDLNHSDNIIIINQYLDNNYEDLANNANSNFKEITHVIFSVLENNNIDSSGLIFENVMDERKMPTFFITSKIEESIANNDDFNLFLLLLVSIENKEWHELHPEHLKLVLRGIKKYNNSELLKDSLIDILKNNKIF